MKLALLTSYNSDLFKKNFEKFLLEKDIDCTCWWNGYGLHEQSVFDKSSKLYSFEPDILIVHYEIEWLLGDLTFDILSTSTDDRKNKIEAGKAKLAQVFNVLMEELPNTKIIIENFSTRSAPLLGLLDKNINFGLSEIVTTLNQYLHLLKEQNNRLVINNFSELVSQIGKENVYDSRFYRLAKNPFARPFYNKLFEHYYSAINVYLLLRKKCIVVDLDNTLWGGVIGQDGIDNIELGGNGAGEAYVFFQKALLNYYRKGIFIAVCSKNNFDDAVEVIEKHPDMILRKDHFSSMKINWEDKASNIKSIANELNIGTDSLVFLDDNPAECELVKQQLPEVEVINLTGDPDNYVKQLLDINSLQSVEITNEDLSRNIMHSADGKRKELEQNFSNLDDYYKSLEMNAYISVNNETHTSRIAQLTQKTNQFNLTTKRYSVEDIKTFITDGKHKVYTLRLTDKFGDNGIVLVAIVKLFKAEWLIDTFLMSCRVIGRQAETALLNKIIDDANAENIKYVKGEFIRTKKNLPAENFYSDHGFSKNSGNEWSIILPPNLKNHFINIIAEE